MAEGEAGSGVVRVKGHWEDFRWDCFCGFEASELFFEKWGDVLLNDFLMGKYGDVFSALHGKQFGMGDACGGSFCMSLFSFPRFSECLKSF